MDSEARRDQLTTAPAATADDAAPRVHVNRSAPGVRRVEVRDDAAVRPGGGAEA
jgi:hypothetical protein